MVIMCTPSAATVRQTAWGSSEPGRRTTLPPANSQDRLVHCPAACMRGATGRKTAADPSGAMRSTMPSGVVMAPSRRAGSPPPMQEWKASSWRQTTPLGMPVVPPV